MLCFIFQSTIGSQGLDKRTHHLQFQATSCGSPGGWTRRWRHRVPARLDSGENCKVSQNCLKPQSGAQLTFSVLFSSLPSAVRGLTSAHTSSISRPPLADLQAAGPGVGDTERPQIAWQHGNQEEDVHFVTEAAGIHAWQHNKMYKMRSQWDLLLHLNCARVFFMIRTK